jgi:hypothetical protein
MQGEELFSFDGGWIVFSVIAVAMAFCALFIARYFLKKV